MLPTNNKWRGGCSWFFLFSARSLSHATMKERPFSRYLLRGDCGAPSKSFPPPSSPVIQSLPGGRETGLGPLARVLPPPPPQHGPAAWPVYYSERPPTTRAFEHHVSSADSCKQTACRGFTRRLHESPWMGELQDAYFLFRC